MPRPALTPCQQWDTQLLLQAQGVRVVFLDVDGVLTDGGLYFSAEGESLKRFHTLDGHGLKMLQKARELDTTPRALADEMSQYFKEM